MRPTKMLDAVAQVLDRLVEAAEPWQGMFPSMLDRRTGEMLRDGPPAIVGQRDGDRAWRGGNLMHDHVTLKLMAELDAAGIGDGWGSAAERYLGRFAEHCTDTLSGLFPWGEHSYWHLGEDRVGNSHRPHEREHAVHDHLRQAPVWLWERLWRLNPRCVERFAEGLDNHWTRGEPREYIRHAFIMQRAHYPRGQRSCDFPRHSGFYILDWAFAWLRTDRDEFLDQLRLMLDYWWEKRLETGLLLVESRSADADDIFHGIGGPSQTLSLAVSLLETAELLDRRLPDVASTMRERAGVYLEGFLSAPHRPEEDVYLNTFDLSTGAPHRPMAAWGSRYGSAAAAGPAVLCVRGGELTGDERLLRWAGSVADWYLREPFHADIAVPARDAGLALELLAALHEATGESRWLAGGLERAGELADTYLDGALPRGASGIDWYESQLGPERLLHGMARVALLAESGGSCPVSPDCSGR